MDTIIIAYWTQTGNTKAMAEAVGEGVETAGKKADVRHISEVSMDRLREAQAFALGCPAMGAEVLEESAFEPFFTELEPHLAGKPVALFGSYGWGDGQWMRDWADRVRAAGAQLCADPVTVNEAPQDSELDECRALGRALAAQ